MTEQQILDAIRAKYLPDADALVLTKPELEERLGIGDKPARRLLGQLIDDGVVVPVKATRVNRMGTPTLVPAYRFTAGALLHGA
jgi:DNA-binding GntR family transcriptional regulator